MNVVSAFLLVSALMVSTSCKTMKERTLSVANSGDGQEAVLTINTKLRSYFDPDGFSREYNPRIRIRVFGHGRNMAYRNIPGITFKFGRDFDVDIDYCAGGYIWINEDRSVLGVALFDVKPPTQFAPLKDFNGKYPLTKKEAEILLRHQHLQHSAVSTAP